MKHATAYEDVIRILGKEDRYEMKRGVERMELWKGVRAASGGS